MRVDEGELGIALLNLCVNARDAMPQGGTITIAAANRPDIGEYGLIGDFVELSVSDTGEGMDAETIARCLEPFYTTKDVGKGSGLGLAQVYGFAHGSEGSVQIESKAHEGTKVLLLLPRSKEPPSASRAHRTCARMPRSASAACRVLLVEDDVQVASLTSAMLAELGYEVIPVTTGQAALDELAQTPGYWSGAIRHHDAGRDGRSGSGAGDAPTPNLIAGAFGQRLCGRGQTRSGKGRHSAAAEALYLQRSGGEVARYDALSPPGNHPPPHDARA